MADVVSEITKVAMANAETAAYILGGFILYRLAAPYLNTLLAFIPAMVRPGVVGAIAAGAGILLHQPILIGLGGGAIAYNVVNVGLPAAQMMGDAVGSAMQPGVATLR